jgi:acetyltransferase-like isoleucine patch superfamily enzyme
MEQLYIAPWPWKAIGKDSIIYENCTILKPEEITLGDYVRVDSLCKLEGGGGLTIGAYVHVASFCHINAGGGVTVIGDHAGLATGAKILSGQPDLSFLAICPTEPSDQVHPIRKTTTIGEYAFICANAVILPGITMGRGAVAAAGSVITHDIPDFEVWAGIPAKPLGKRVISQ